MYDDEEIVDSNSENKEGNDLDDNEGDVDPGQVQEADGAQHSQEHYQDSHQPQGDLHVNLGRSKGDKETHVHT